MTDCQTNACDATTLTFSAPEAMGAVVRLSAWGMVKLSGKDARDFLQRVLTNEVIHLGTKHALTGYCDPKGRLLGTMRYWLTGETDVMMMIPKSSAPAIIKRLKMFVLRDDVKIDCAMEGRTLWAITRKAHDVLTKAGLPVAGVDEVATSDTATVLGLRAAVENDTLGVGADRALVVTNADFAWPCGKNCALEPNNAQFFASEILAGMPSVFAPTSGLFVPQAVNLDLVDGVSFTKGCYPGQEVVSRLKHVGKTNRRGFVSLTTGDVPAPGADVYAEGSTDPVGYVVYAAKVGDVVAVMTSNLIEARDAGLKLTVDGAVMTPVTLPYALD